MDYSKFKFPPYEYHEYPKMVGDVVVQSREEEDALREAATDVPTEPAKRAYHRKDS